MRTLTRIVVVLSSFLLSTALSFAEVPQTHPNSRRYSDGGAKPGTGRSGSASIQARALLGSDGVTEIDVTTGALDSPSAPGNIDKVQVKLRNGSSTATRNHNNLRRGGMVALYYSGLRRSEAVQLQANVSGIDPNRTDVVTVETSVMLRPDLAVISIDAPAQARPSIPVVIFGTLTELNGDVGATADCVLSVDGVQVDQSPDIWVDAGGTVSCEFAYAFATTGKKKLTIAARNVAPADFNEENNSAEREIEVLNPTTEFRKYSASAVDFEFSSSFRAWSSIRTENTNTHGWSNAAHLFGEVGAVNFAHAKASVRHINEGALLSEQHFDLRPGWQTGDGTAGGGCFFSTRDFHWLQACGTWRLVGGTRTGTTSVQTGRNAGSVTYHSDGWDKRFIGAGGSYYTWNIDWTQQQGVQTRLGRQYELQVTVDDGETIYAASPVIQLLPFQSRFDQPVRCITTWDLGTYCFEMHSSTTGLVGTAFEQN